MAFPSLWYWDYVVDDDDLNDQVGQFGDDNDSSRRKLLLDNLQSFTSELPLCISSDDTHHTMIATILILDRASLFYASPSRPTREDALNQACSQYKSSDTHTAVKERFLLPPKQYSISQFTGFVLSHLLQ